MRDVYHKRSHWVVLRTRAGTHDLANKRCAVRIPPLMGISTPNPLSCSFVSLSLVCYLRCGEQVFETYWTNGRGVEAMVWRAWPMTASSGWRALMTHDGMWHLRVSV
jgi:hypothetical protein